MSERPDAISAEIVQQFVLECHRNFDMVKEMLAETPALANACWDWGAGDFESAIGAAAHTGNREMAEHLLANGARIDLPTAVMMGKLDLVKAILTAFPSQKDVPGAHGIPLMVHARMGGEAAADVLAYLQSLG